MIVTSEVQTKRFGKIKICSNPNEPTDNLKPQSNEMSSHKFEQYAKALLLEHNKDENSHLLIVDKLVNKIIELFEYAKTLEKRISKLEEK